MNYCPKCDKYVEDDRLSFCNECGGPLIQLLRETNEISGEPQKNGIEKENLIDNRIDDTELIPSDFKVEKEEKDRAQIHIVIQKELFTTVSINEQEGKTEQHERGEIYTKERTVAIDESKTDTEKSAFSKMMRVAFYLIILYVIYNFVPSLIPSSSQNINHYIQMKNQFDYEIAALANDINAYTVTHADFRNANELIGRGQSIAKNIQEEKRALQNADIDNKALKTQLLIVIDTEIERINGLVNGMLNSKNGGNYLPEFKKGTNAAYRFDEENAKLTKMQ